MECGGFTTHRFSEPKKKKNYSFAIARMNVRLVCAWASFTLSLWLDHYLALCTYLDIGSLLSNKITVSDSDFLKILSFPDLHKIGKKKKRERGQEVMLLSF